MEAESIVLSKNALHDLRATLRSSYGQYFDKDFSDEEINKLGFLLLTTLAEGLKLEIACPELSAS
jgi:hypothetical protein